MSLQLTQHLIGDPATSFVAAPLISVPFTTITNRAQVRDLSQDQGVRMGIDRIPMQQAFETQNEFGASGEKVFVITNDDRGLIRLVGTWTNDNAAEGPCVYTTTVGSYLEVTFYGTGLNMLIRPSAATQDVRLTVDGGAEGGATVISAQSTVLGGRNYAINAMAPIVSGLTAGHHTIKLRNNNTAFFQINGLEIVHESSTVRVNPGKIVKDQRQVTLESAVNQAYKPTTLTGTKGGRVVLYNQGGVIGTAIQAVDVSQLNLSSASHNNEEIVRTYFPREFGAGRADDYSSLVASTSQRGFTIEDGTTTLASTGAQLQVLAGYETLFVGATGLNAFTTFTFVGTGLDVFQIVTGTTDTVGIFVDGVSTGSYTPTVTGLQKIVSGLPYGSHTVKFNRNVNANNNPNVAKFIVYGPKKPTLPTGAAELADYNVLADYVANTTATDVSIMSAGVLHKSTVREMAYTGTWTLTAGFTNDHDSWRNSPSALVGTNFVQYSFFGTGVEVWGRAVTTSYPMVVAIDGSNYTGAATAQNNGSGTAVSWTPGTSVWVTGSGNFCRLQITGLTLGVHTIKLTTNSASDQFMFFGMDVITPVHAPKSNLYAGLQNALPVGSCGVNDSRQLLASNQSPLKAWTQAVGVSASPTTTSATDAPIPDMSITMKTNGGPIEIFYRNVLNQSGGGTVVLSIYVDGVLQTPNSVISNFGATVNLVVSDSIIVPVVAGVHNIYLAWNTNAPTLTASGTRRVLKVREL